MHPLRSLSLALVLVTASAQAVSVDYIGANLGQYDTYSNWTGGVTPNWGDTASINNRHVLFTSGSLLWRGLQGLNLRNDAWLEIGAARNLYAEKLDMNYSAVSIKRRSDTDFYETGLYLGSGDHVLSNYSSIYVGLLGSLEVSGGTMELRDGSSIENGVNSTLVHLGTIDGSSDYALEKLSISSTNGSWPSYLGAYGGGAYGGARTDVYAKSVVVGEGGLIESYGGIELKSGLLEISKGGQITAANTGWINHRFGSVINEGEITASSGYITFDSDPSYGTFVPWYGTDVNAFTNRGTIQAFGDGAVVIRSADVRNEGFIQGEVGIGRNGGNFTNKAFGEVVADQYTFEPYLGNFTNDGLISFRGGGAFAMAGFGQATNNGRMVISDPIQVTFPRLINYGNLNVTGGGSLSIPDLRSDHGTLSVSGVGSRATVSYAVGEPYFLTDMGNLFATNGSSVDVLLSPSLFNTFHIDADSGASVRVQDPQLYLFDWQNGGTGSVSSIQVSNGAVIETNGGVSNGGMIDVQQDGTFRSGGLLTQSSSGTLDLKGTLDVRASGFQINGGLLQGNGTVLGNTLVNGGTIRPGDPNVLTFDGDLTLKPNANVDLQIEGSAGPGVAGGYDQLLVTNTAVLGGSLRLKFSNGYRPGAGSFWPLINAKTIAGSFLSVTHNLGANYQLSWSNGGISVQAVPEPTSLAALGLGVAAMLRRRSRK